METKAGQQLTQIQKNISTAAQKLTTPDKKVVVVIGDTGHGKSTLVNYIANNPLRAQFDKYEQCILQAVQPWNELRIKGGSVSETTEPNRWVDKDTGYVYLDCPGFGDTKGIVQDVSNGFYIHKVFEEAEEVKVVVVVSQNTFNDRKQPFVSLLKTLTEMFNDLEQLCSCLVFVVTKTKLADPKKIKDNIKELIPKPQQESSLSSAQLFLLTHLASPKSKVQLFRQPQKAGPIDMSPSKKIKGVINSLRPASKMPIRVPISPKSEILMTGLAKQLNQLVSKECHSLNRVVKSVCRTVINSGNTSKEVKNRLGQIASLVKNMVQSKDKQQLVETLGKLSKHMDRQDAKELLMRIGQNVSLLDFINGVREEKYDVAEWGRQLSVAQQIDSAIERPVATKEGNHLYITGVIVGAGQVAECIKAKVDQTVQSVHVLVFDTIYIDHDLYNPGLSTLIFAVNWKVFGKRIISLKGADGTPYHMQKARDGLNQEEDGVGRSGQNGLSGNDGKNGGSFFGKVMGQGSVANLQNLTIDVSGGSGGRGQEGGDGSNGRDGIDGDYEEVKSRDKKYLIDSKEYTFSDKDFLGKSTHIVKMFMTFNGQTLQFYRSQGSQIGGKGGNGGAGGFGGRGGLSGNAQLVGFKIQSEKIVNSAGKDGPDGQGGKPGEGGKNGRPVEGKYVNEMLFADFRGGLFQNVKKTAGKALVVLGLQLIEQVVKKTATIGVSSAIAFPVVGIASGISAYTSSNWLEEPHLIPNGEAQKGITLKSTDYSNKKTVHVPLQKAQFSDQMIKQVEGKFQKSRRELAKKTRCQQQWFATS